MKIIPSSILLSLMVITNSYAATGVIVNQGQTTLTASNTTKGLPQSIEPGQAPTFTVDHGSIVRMTYSDNKGHGCTFNINGGSSHKGESSVQAASIDGKSVCYAQTDYYDNYMIEIRTPG